MIPTININEENLTINYNYKFKDACEANTYAATYKDRPSITKFFINKDCIVNKITKMNLIKERTKDIDIIVTADAFIEQNGEIIGYVMPDIYGINIYNDHFSCKRKQLIWYLKQLGTNLKELHKLGIIAGDYTHNTILKDNKIYFIDHDNFAIDNYKTDKMNRYMMRYAEVREKIDMNFDFYLLNLYTFTLLVYLILEMMKLEKYLKKL